MNYIEFAQKMEKIEDDLDSKLKNEKCTGYVDISLGLLDGDFTPRQLRIIADALEQYNALRDSAKTK